MPRDAGSSTVSVLIPAHNAGAFLRAAIVSVYSQTVSPAEVIVVNDGSTDETESILRELAEHADPPLRWVTTEKRGEAEARNATVAMAAGDFLAFLDHDDEWHTTKLERQLAQFADDPELDLSFTAYSRVENGSRHLVRHEGWDSDREVVLVKLLRSCALGTASSIMVRRDAMARVPPFDGSLALGCDWLMWLNLAGEGVKIGYLDEPLVEYRWHGGNLSDDPRGYYRSACEIVDRFFARSSSVKPPHSARWWRARWRMLAAIDAIQAGDRSRARRYILSAARIRPASVRPGWLRMAGIGTPPR